jgi:tetratricopeptide (TPR) repeat protein
MQRRMTTRRGPGVIALVFALALGTAGAARADGGGNDGGGQDMRTCPRGQVWDSRTQRCVQAQSGILPDKTLADNAYALAKAERYDEALAVLDLMQDRETPEALNYRGYATRKLGRIDEGIGYYLKSVALDPQYAQVREYLGEAYVIKGDVEKARGQSRQSAAPTARNTRISRRRFPSKSGADAA